MRRTLTITLASLAGSAALIGGLAGCGSTPAPAAAPPAQSAPASSAPAQQAPPAPARTAKPAKPAITVSQQQALDSAKSYLDMGGFSRAGLIGQLSSQAGEKFPLADATWAADHAGADWNAQAVLSAKSYMEMGGFSRSGLIDQLSSSAGEQFTLAQATYAANHVGLSGSGGASQSQAVQPASAGLHQVPGLGGVYASSATSDGFARGVVAAWQADPAPGVKSVYSPVTGQTYAMTYQIAGAGHVIATGGTGARVEF